MSKILFLTNMYPSIQNPTYGIFVKKTYEWLTEEHSVTLIKIAKTKITIIKLIKYIMFYMKAIIRALFFKYDCIYAHYISHNAIPIYIIKKLKKDIVVIGNIHGEDVFSEYKRYKINRKRSKRFLRYADYIIAPSIFFKNKLCQEYGYDINKVIVSPSGGVDTNLFKKTDKCECQKKMDLNEKVKYVGYVSRIEEGKGWDIFLQAVSLVRTRGYQVEAIIVGTGLQQELMNELACKLGIQNIIHRYIKVTHDMLNRIYNCMDVFCFCSRIENESLGLVGLEAMACNVPCIITNSKGPGSYANENNCLLFNATNYVELADCMEKYLLMDQVECKKIIENAHNDMMKYECKVVKAEFLKFFDMITNIELEDKKKK